MVSTRRQRSNSRTNDNRKRQEKSQSQEKEVEDKEESQIIQNAEKNKNENNSNGSAEQEENGSLKVAESETSEQERVIRIRPRKGGLGLRSKTADSGKNELSKLIPGYTAEMRLKTPSLSTFRPVGGIQDLIRKAECSDASTRNFVGQATNRHIDAMQRTATGSISTYDAAYSSFKKGVKKPKDNSAGKGWFNMQPTPMSDELKADLSVIRNRSYLDPKRFYKSSEKYNKVVQVGTVIEGASEFYSSRLTKKQRRSNITEEILADTGTSSWATNKFKKMQKEKTERSKQRRKRGRSRR